MASPAHSLHPVPGLLRLGLLARVVRVVLAVVIGVLCYQFSPHDFERISRLMMGWDGFLLAVLQLTWLTIFRARTDDIQRASHKMHPERTWVMLLTVTFVGTATSLLAVVLLLRGLHQMNHDERWEHVLVSMVAVTATWLLLHTLFALHYAHTYFSQEQETGATRACGGLQFSGGRAHLVLGFCLLLVRGWDDDPDRRCNRDIVANAPTGAFPWAAGLCLQHRHRGPEY